MIATSTALSSQVALRKESVDRNGVVDLAAIKCAASLSARRAWIEMVVVWRWR